MGKASRKQKERQAEEQRPAQMKMLIRSQGFDVGFIEDAELKGSVFQITFPTKAGDVKVQMPESGAPAMVEALVALIDKRAQEATLVSPEGKTLVD